MWDGEKTNPEPTGSARTCVLSFHDFVGEAGSVHIQPGGSRSQCMAYDILLKNNVCSIIHSINLLIKVTLVISHIVFIYRCLYV